MSIHSYQLVIRQMMAIGKRLNAGLSAGIKNRNRNCVEFHKSPGLVCPIAVTIIRASQSHDDPGLFGNNLLKSRSAEDHIQAWTNYSTNAALRPYII